MKTSLGVKGAQGTLLVKNTVMPVWSRVRGEPCALHPSHGVRGDPTAHPVSPKRCVRARLYRDDSCFSPPAERHFSEGPPPASRAGFFRPRARKTRTSAHPSAKGEGRPPTLVCKVAQGWWGGGVSGPRKGQGLRRAIWGRG